MKYLLMFLISITFFSCREEVISPDNPAGNINQPVIESYLNSYSFVINAGDITYSVYESMLFDYSRTQVFVSVIDHSSGYVEISVLNKSKQLVFSKKANTDIDGELSKLEGQIPESLFLNFQNFTGKLRLTVTRY